MNTTDPTGTPSGAPAVAVPAPTDERRADAAAAEAAPADTTPALVPSADTSADATLAEPAAADALADEVFDGQTEADIDALQQVCERLNGFGADLSVEWVDGYLTALLAGRRTLSPEEWLPALCGDAFERAFADPQDAAQALQAMLVRWNDIASALDPQALVDAPDELRLSPLIVNWDDAARADAVAQGLLDADEAAEQLHSGGVWADGFFSALEAFADDWPSPAQLGLDDEEAGWYDDTLARITHLVLPASELAQLMAEHYDEPLSRDELIDEACFAVQDLRMFWLNHPVKPSTRVVGEKTGRNDPCPCGSGKKFKKCCGA